MGSEICPVCGSKRKKTAVSAYDCENCGFENAYATYFAGEKSFAAWNERALAAKKKYSLLKAEEDIRTGTFALGGNAVSFVSLKTGRLTAVFGDGHTETAENVKQISFGERNYAVLYNNGKVKVFGDDNTYGQKNTAEWLGMKYVLATSSCVYGVTADGEVWTAGMLAGENVSAFRGVAKLSGGAEYVAALTKDGRVLVDGNLPDASFSADVSAWKNVRDIAASRNGLLALHADGTVSFAGKKNDTRKAAELWRGVEAIASDGVFAVGVTRGGELLLAGSCKAFLDKGRSGARDWKDVISVACNQSGIGAVTKNGELLFAGAVSGDIDKIKSAWRNSVVSTFGHTKIDF